MATTTDLGNVNIFSSLASFNSNKANLKSNDLNFIKQTAAEMAVVGGGIVAQLLAENGYVKFANGLILQWGVHTNNKSVNDSQSLIYTVNFPISFFSVCYAVIGSPFENTNNRYAYRTGHHIYSKELASFIYAIGTEQQGSKFIWVAIGK